MTNRLSEVVKNFTCPCTVRNWMLFAASDLKTKLPPPTFENCHRSKRQMTAAVISSKPWKKLPKKWRSGRRSWGREMVWKSSGPDVSALFVILEKNFLSLGLKIAEEVGNNSGPSCIAVNSTVSVTSSHRLSHSTSLNWQGSVIQGAFQCLSRSWFTATPFIILNGFKWYTCLEKVVVMIIFAKLFAISVIAIKTIDHCNLLLTRNTRNVNGNTFFAYFYLFFISGQSQPRFVTTSATFLGHFSVFFSDYIYTRGYFSGLIKMFPNSSYLDS